MFFECSSKCDTHYPHSPQSLTHNNASNLTSCRFGDWNWLTRANADLLWLRLRQWSPGARVFSPISAVITINQTTFGFQKLMYGEVARTCPWEVGTGQSWMIEWVASQTGLHEIVSESVKVLLGLMTWIQSPGHTRHKEVGNLFWRCLPTCMGAYNSSPNWLSTFALIPLESGGGRDLDTGKTLLWLLFKKNYFVRSQTQVL